MNHLTYEDYASIGMAIVACSQLENVLMRLEAINYDPEIVAAKAYDQKLFQKATRASFSDYAERLGTELEKKIAEQSSAQAIIDSLLGRTVDQSGRKMDAPIVRWRNLLCHGAVTKLSDGRIHFEFDHRNSFMPLPSDHSLIQSHLEKTTDADELSQFARSVAQATKIIIELFYTDTP